MTEKIAPSDKPGICKTQQLYYIMFAMRIIFCIVKYNFILIRVFCMGRN